MIQRIQSIYLLLSALFMGGLFHKNADLLTIQATNPVDLNEMYYFNDQILDIYDQNILIAFVVLVIFFPILAIFLYRKRNLQITLSRVSVLIVLLFLVFTFYLSYADLASIVSKVNINPEWGIFLPFLVIISLILAVRGIRKDNKLVKSMDRLR